MTQHSPPAGWYEHPGGGIRWWDGAAWTAHTHDGPAPAASPNPAVYAQPLSPGQPVLAAPAAPAASVLTAPVAATGPDDEQLWDYGAAAEPASAPKGTGLYREMPARLTGIVMLIGAVLVLGWVVVGPLLTGPGHAIGIGPALWLAGGLALLIGGINRISSSRRAPAAAVAPVAVTGVGEAAPAVPVPTGPSAPVTSAWPSSSVPPAAAAPGASAFAASTAGSWQPTAPSAAVTAVPYSGYGKQPRSGHVGVGSRGRVLAVLGVIAVLLVGYGFYASRSGTDEPAPAAAAAQKPAAPAPPKAAKPWAPKGWKQVAGGVAWKKSATVSKDCEINTACVKIAVMTKAACPMVRVEVAFRDAARAELSTSVAYAKKLQPKKYKVVRVSSPNAEEARYATLTSVKCMDAA